MFSPWMSCMNHARFFHGTSILMAPSFSLATNRIAQNGSALAINVKYPITSVVALNKGRIRFCSMRERQKIERSVP